MGVPTMERLRCILKCQHLIPNYDLKGVRYEKKENRKL